MRAKGKIFYGWYVVAGLFAVAALGPMGRYILTALFPFIMKDPGWSRESIGFAFTLHFWAYALLALLAGRLVDRIGGRATIFLGGVLILAGLLLLSRVGSLWHFYLVFGLVLAAGVAMTHFVPNTAVVRKWFIQKAGLATGLVTVGTVMGFAFLPPGISYLSARFGWREAAVVCAFALGIPIMGAALALIRNTPESLGLGPDGTPLGQDSAQGELSPQPGEEGRGFFSDTLLSRNFIWFFVAYSVIGIPLQGVLAHVIIWGVELGYPSGSSGIIMAALTLPSVPVRVVAGWLGDRYGKRRVLIFFNLMAAVIWIMGWLTVKDQGSFLFFIVLLGFAYSAPFSLYTPYLGDLFGRAVVGTLMGLLTLGHGIIGGSGPYLWGWIADRTGSYQLNCLISCLCYLVVALALYLLKDPGGSGRSAHSSIHSKE